MAFLFGDGVGHLDLTTSPQKWSSVGSTSLILAGGGRYGDAGALAGSALSQATTFWHQNVSPVTPASGVIGFWHYITGAVTGGGLPSASFETFSIFDGATRQLTLSVGGIGGGLNGVNVFRGSRSGTQIASATVSIPAAGWWWFELQFTIHPSAGAVSFRAFNSSGTLAGSVTATGLNTRNSAASQWTGFSLWPGLTGRFSAVIVLDLSGTRLNTLTGPVRVFTTFPSADDGVAWTPSAGTNHAAVDETPPTGDTDYVRSTVTGDIDRYTMTPLSYSGLVLAAQLNLSARKEAGGDTNTLAPVTRIDGVDYVGSAQALTTSYADSRSVWELAPDTSTPWTIAKVNAASFGQKDV